VISLKLWVSGRLAAMKKTLVKLHAEIDTEGPKWK